VDAALQVHRALGAGLLETVYEICLAHELRKRGLSVRRQEPVPIVYDGLRFEEAFRFDLLVGDRVLCEIKSVMELHPICTAQLLTYLKLMDLRLGFLINFNERLIKDGLNRIVL
jgi:GxxExxY protein